MQTIKLVAADFQLAGAVHTGWLPVTVGQKTLMSTAAPVLFLPEQVKILLLEKKRNTGKIPTTAAFFGNLSHFNLYT